MSPRAQRNHNSDDPFKDKGAVEQDRPSQQTNMSSLGRQIDHRDQNPIKKGNDTDFPEPGESPEYSMQKQDTSENDPLRPKRDPDGNAEARLNDQDPGESQKENQNDQKDDPLAA